MNAKRLCIIGAAVLTLCSCGTQKSAVSTRTKTSSTATTASNAVSAQFAFADKVNDNAMYQKNIVSGITFTTSVDGGKEISLPGQLRMRKDEVVRLTIQLPLLGTEVARIEFGRDNVLFIDRMHKEYVRAGYNEVAFLRDNGINFYSLQALFWNKLLKPGSADVKYGDLNVFSVNLNGNGTQVPVTLKDGKLTYTWLANRNTAQIEKATVDYASTSNGHSTLTWQYGDFRSMGSKRLPYLNTLSITTSAGGRKRTMRAVIELNNASTSDNWDANTTVSSKYRQVPVDEILSKITKL